MSEKKILEVLTDIEDRYIEEANPLTYKKRASFKKLYWVVAACMCLLVMGGYALSLQMTREPFVAFEINKEESIATIPYEDSYVYLFQREIEEEYEYSFEAILEKDGMYYKLSTDTNNEEKIYAMVDMIVGEQKKSILGFSNYYVVAEEPFKDFVNWKYFVEVDGVEICLAEVFGYTNPKTEVYQKDLDGDGASELICSSMYGTGVQRIYIFRNHNGVIEVGYLCYDLWNEAMFPGIIDRGSVYVQEVYHPENGTFEIIYTVEDGTRSVFLENLEWVEFVPFEKGYF